MEGNYYYEYVLRGILQHGVLILLAGETSFIFFYFEVISFVRLYRCNIFSLTSPFCPLWLTAELSHPHLKLASDEDF
jgi:hypothetical protein